ncbi:MAG: FAD-dependent oxidoreductase, partial [Rhodospirillaceae bacterium]|nr:FAD-dependent oxidoreductase [Rhodospirillaceae bacterium]
LKQSHLMLDPIYACKRLFVQRRALKGKTIDDAMAIDGETLGKEISKNIGGELTELAFAAHVMGLLDDEETNKDKIAKAADYALWATYTIKGRARHAKDVLFNEPQKIDANNLVKTDTVEIAPGVEALNFAPQRLHYRDGFKLSDNGCNLTGALDEANYCVICHERGKDSCSKGLRDKKTGDFAKNESGIDLTGCPLEERISEMHKAKMDGHALSALALIAVDNPLCAGTGHRICNDCMKSCIYQKQTPVNIPEVETRALKDILGLPWGFEIYSLLTRWNPMNIRRPVPKDDSGYKVLVVGAGPAGSALSHHLMNDGHAVVMIDGAKLEPLDAALNGTTPFGERVEFDPIENVKDICESLDERVLAGFGGVAEYGITVRWDKNFLKLERLLLERRNSFRMFGGVRFGAQITKQQAFGMGFDHIALCMGAGKPTILDIKNNLAPGVRQASDFLMALQLTGAAKSDNIANLQLRLPAVIIGGGLTAIDTATEALAYYVAQCEKFIHRFETMSGVMGEDVVRANWTTEDHEIASEFLSHGQAIRIERRRAKKENREPDLTTLLNKWGGATIAYRRRMIDSPSYTLNHEEIEKAFEQGIRFAELLSPTGIEVDEFGWVGSITMERQQIDEDGKLSPSGKTVSLPARAVLVAAGTQPNTVLAREDEAFAKMDGKYFAAVDENGKSTSPERSDKPEKVEVLVEIEKDGRAVSFFGDLHPSFAGNVVKAMASAKQGYPVITKQLQKTAPTSTSFADIGENLKQGLVASVVSVKRLTPTIVEVVIKAPMAASAFKPGQFFRLQNFESLSDICGQTRMAMEGLALTGAEADVAAGTVSLIVLEMGGSSNLCANLQPGSPVVLMGPSGTPTETPGGETVLLAGG